MLKISKLSTTLVPIIMLTGTIILSAIAWNFSYQQSIRSIKQDLRDSLVLSLSSLKSEIERFRYLPFVIAQDQRIIDAINYPQDKHIQNKANVYLQSIQRNSKADKLFVLDEHGTTLASSNWNEPLSFVGRNYSFRPYFQKALTESNNRFYAVGVTTGEAGYFMSSLILTPEGKRGVAVVKIDLAPLENTWNRAANSLALFDENGVIILSGKKSWKYRPIQKLSSKQLKKILTEKTYPVTPQIRYSPLIAPDQSEKAPENNTSLPEISYITSQQVPDLIVSIPLREDNWHLFATRNLSSAVISSRFYAILVGLCGLLLSIAYFYLRQRQQFIQFKLKQNCILEKKVEKRTKALEKEIEIRTLAEKELVKTQDNLIQNAKLAVLGRMSAAIVHEISQPLSAIDTILSTAQANHTNRAFDNISANLENSRNLVTRIKRTIKHLKTFSKKENATFESVDLVKAVIAAIEIAQPRIKEAGIILHFNNTQKPAIVRANFLRIEQVVLNLILNAVDAIEQASQGKIDIDINRMDKSYQILVKDNGSGIEDGAESRLTEPFFSTKTTSGGLGLGLSISSTIIEEYDGTLDFKHNESNGVTAIVTFPSPSISDVSASGVEQ